MDHENKPYSLVRNIKFVYILAFSVVSVFYVMSVVAISYYERKAGVEHQVEDLSSFVLGYYSHFGSIYYEDLKIGLATSRVQESLRKEDYKDLEKMIVEHQLARSSDFVVLLDDSEVKFAVNRYNYRVYSQLLESLSDPSVISKIQAKREILIVYSGRVISAANIALEGGNTDLSILVFSEVTSSLLKEYTSFMSHRFYFENINSSLGDIEVIDLQKDTEVITRSVFFEHEQYISKSSFYQNGRRYFDLIMYEEYSIYDINQATWVAIVSLPFGAVLISGIWLMFSRRNLRPVKDMVESLRQTSSIDISSGPDELMVFSNNYKRLAAELESKNHFNELLIRSITDIIFTVDNLGHVNFANDAALKWIDLNLAKIEGHKASLLFSNMDRDTMDVATWIHKCSEHYESIKTQGDLIPITNREWVYRSEIICQPLDRNARRSSAIIIIKILTTIPVDDYLALQKND